ncbi:hypothetical protein VNO78_08853 [Psophocarpus tetragonolobus]|uniref:Protein SPT2 homolog n=1 Tax=Psophocarpus tetragonolobus TaxID=3891 RepID=A0AAN9XTA6_PSOTE
MYLMVFSSRQLIIIFHPKSKEVNAQKLKVTRDYSFFLSDDVELLAPKKESSYQKTPVHNSDERPTEVAWKNKQPLVNGGKIVPRSYENWKLVTGPGHLAPKSRSNYKLSSTNKPSKTSADSRKQLSSNSGNGLSQPLVSKGLPSKMLVGNKSLTPGMKNPGIGVQKPLSSKLHSVNGEQKSFLSKLHSAVPEQCVEQRKDVREQNKPKMISKQPVASTKAQIKKPLTQIPKHSDLQDHCPKKKIGKRYYDEVEDEMDVSRMMGSMFNYNPNKFVDDDDDADMEAGFDEIMKEERRRLMKSYFCMWGCGTSRASDDQTHWQHMSGHVLLSWQIVLSLWLQFQNATMIWMRDAVTLSWTRVCLWCNTYITHLRLRNITF